MSLMVQTAACRVCLCFFLLFHRTLLTVAQPRWNGAALELRVLCLPKVSAGSPLDPMVAGSPASFATANFKFEVHILNDIDTLPSPGGTVVATVTTSASTSATGIFRALAQQFPIDPTPVTGIKKPPNSKVKKHLPLTYQNAVNYAGTNSNICFTDDTYSCMMGQGKSTYQKLPPPNPKWAWGRVIAMTLRNTGLALATGLVRPISVPLPDPSLLRHGGYVYITLASGSDGSGLANVSDGLKIYAARVPPLTAARDLFSPVFFPVVDPPPSEDYATIFAEAIDYDDGWAKAVHCTQSAQVNHLQEGLDGPRPAKENGIRIGWDDEQVAVWTNRQLDDTQTFDSPLGAQGYRVDVSVEGSHEWHSLVRAKGPVALPGATVDHFDGELCVEVAPAQLDAQKHGDYWLPTYFTSWTGPSLVTADENMLQFLGGIDLSARDKVRGQRPDIDLRYGRSYSFRVRLADHTGGGPSVSGSPTIPGPSPVGSIGFCRFVRPGALVLVSPDPTTLGIEPDFEHPPASITLRRPRLAYPAVVCTGAYTNAIQLLLNDLPTAANEKREVGLFDPDVNAVRVTVEVAGFAEDPLATDNGYRLVYQTSKTFPTDPNALLNLSISWQPFDQITDLHPDESPTGPLILPTARSIRLRFEAECKLDPDLKYFGADDVRYGPNIRMDLGKYSTTETGLYQGQLPSKAINGFFFRPDTPIDSTLITAQQTTGNPTSAPSDLASRAANAFGLQNRGYMFYGPVGRRTVFSCASNLLHIISPDQGSITFSSPTDLTLHWIVALRLTINRDWTWDGIALNGINVQRDGISIASFSPNHNIDSKLFQQDPDRRSTDLIIFDVIDPKPTLGAFPQELTPTYTITTSLKNSASTDSPIAHSIRLPITTPPSQTPKLASAGIALSPYQRSSDYSSTAQRQRSLWLEFDRPPIDPQDQYYARVLFNAPDPLLTMHPVLPADKPVLEAPLPIDAELVRKIVPEEASDPAGLDAMQALIPADIDPAGPAGGTVQYLLPLPPGMSSASPALFGFYTYEFRVGHNTTRWSTAQGRFGPPLRVAGVQHPAPPLVCTLSQTKDNLLVTAPFAQAVLGDVNVSGIRTTTSMWALIYAQAVLVDGSDRTNVLLTRKEMHGRMILETATAGSDGSGVIAMSDGSVVNSTAYASVKISVKEVNAVLSSLGFRSDAKLSVLTVELFPPKSADDPLGADLGKQRILRVSPLTAVPVIC